MQTKPINISKIVLNDRNPRTITATRFQKLINSLLSLPKMLDIRPIVINEDYTVLGGNMRLRALQAIADMSEEEITSRLNKSNDVKKKSEKQKEALRAYWAAWKKKHLCPS